MEEKIFEILFKTILTNTEINQCTKELLNLFSVSESKGYIHIDNAKIDEAYYYDDSMNYWMVSGNADILIKKEDVKEIRYSR